MLVTSLFFMHIRKAEQMQECRRLLQLLKEVQGISEEVLLYKLMYSLAYLEDTREAQVEVQTSYLTWSMEILDLFECITAYRELNELGLLLLRKLIELGSPSHPKLAYYYYRLSELEEQLKGCQSIRQANLQHFLTYSRTKRP